MLRQNTRVALQLSARLSVSARAFHQGSSILNKEEITSPLQIAKDSHLPNIPQEFKKPPRQASKKAPFLSDHKVESKTYEMSSFTQNLGQFVVKFLNIDMDKTRAGPIAGSYYFGECKRQGMYYPDEPDSDTAKFFYQTLNLPKSFSQWFQITALHYWILSVRMRAMPFQYGKNYQQKLVDRIFSDMEMRMSIEMGINSSRIIEGYLKDYHTQLLGLVVSYDEGLVTDDITLAAALWRNVFSGNPNADVRHIEALVGYVRQQLYVLNKMSDREFGFGKFSFVPPDQVVKLLTKAQEEKLRAEAKAAFADRTAPSDRSVLSLDE
ncbi:hypothetical protein PUMCH_003194 [Australozyma saopauloensis]|uniref:Ubiquinol-cytochrome c chaperone domain-containing protein n=1 Tax=Australozyma saopauloensis TaxID=291208 RepID=A0AAX4HBV0_9ASCO|nr:hypothetical protein PUMCH_003194 [[Candida] saopauloensis]